MPPELPPDPTPRPNRLAAEKSPYLLQHAHNPVDWFPWGDEAFDLAAREDRPIFLSIGYATCHWCHVMERESFEDPAVAALLNDGFVPIKVDREERPDIDAIYMSVCQMMTGHGGWPLTIAMTPDKRPFFAGTYFPRETSHGRIGMLDLLPRLGGLWRERRDDLERAGTAALDAVREMDAQATREGAPALDERTLERGFGELRARYDPHQGGFGRAPKFPTPHQLLFLLRWHARTGRPEPLDMVTHTLGRMRLGGIFDHVGFGFHRYSTDARWLVPHFEKMLYDQALMAMAATDAWWITGDDGCRRIAEEVFTYVLRDLRDPEGAFYSAEDADSEGREGAFYVWTRDELDRVLTDALDAGAAETARRVFAVETRGNFAEEATGERTGENILHLEAPVAELAVTLGRDPEALEREIEQIRSVLFEARGQRPRPLLDDKILTDWNGLAIAALARAGRAFGDARYVDAAAAAARFLSERARDAEHRLLHRVREGEAAILGGASDHAALAWGMIELYAATFDPRWLAEASALASELADRFWDGERGGVFTAAPEATDVPVRQRETYDGAIPSANALAWLVFLRLGHLTGESRWADRAARMSAAFSTAVSQAPSAHAMWLVALDLALGPTHEVVVAGEPEAPDTRALLDALGSAFRPRTAVLLQPGGEAGESLAALAPFTRGHVPVDGRAAAYVCRSFACQRPTTDASEMADLLAEGSGGSTESSPAGGGAGASSP